MSTRLVRRALLTFVLVCLPGCATDVQVVVLSGDVPPSAGPYGCEVNPDVSGDGFYGFRCTEPANLEVGEQCSGAGHGNALGCVFALRCLRACAVDADCPAPGGGSVVPVCSPFSVCELPCDASATCPEGMECVERSGDEPAHCVWLWAGAWPCQILSPPACGDGTCQIDEDCGSCPGDCDGC